MRSPFPGMDPYLEQRWSDVHLKLIAYIADAVQPQLPNDLRARGEEQLLLEAEEPEVGRRRYRSDVAVVEEASRVRTPGGLEESPGVATVAPVIVEVSGSPALDRHVQIIDIKSNNRVVTAIEVLSPWNKRVGRLNRRYRRKIQDYARAGVNLVEIDLLLGSRRWMAVGQDDLPTERRTPYLACVRRADDSDRWAVYPISLRSPLPRIPVPLRAEERDVPLDLQPLIDRAYESGRHDDIDYSQPPDAALKGEDAAWADELLRKAGRRP